MKPEIDLLLAACAIAVFTDVRKRKIPNWLTAGLAAGALALHVPQGWVAVGTSGGTGPCANACGASAKPKPSAKTTTARFFFTT